MFDGVDVYRPPLDPLLVGLLVAALALAVVGVYAWRNRATGLTRRAMMMALRLAAVAAIAWTLAGPSVLRHGEKLGRVEVVMLVDTSASMAEADEGEAGDTARLDALRATWLAPDFLERVRARADLRLIAFDESSRIVSDAALAGASAEGGQTYLFDALRGSIASSGPSPLTVLLTDGHDTRTMLDPSVVAQLRRAGRPVFAVPVGRSLDVTDVAVQAWADADYLFEGQTTTLRATVIQNGFDHQQVRVDLYESGRLVEQRTVTFADEAARTVTFTIAPRTDPSSDQSVTLADYRVRVTPVDASRQQRVLENDEQSVFVQVSRDRMKVALFEGEPYWDTRYLAQVVRADPQADLAAVYQFGPQRQVRVKTGSENDEILQLDPSRLTQEQLNAFDVVILGRRVERLFPGERVNLLVDYVRQRGGAVVMARGRAFTGDAEAQRIIAGIEPVAWGTRAVEHLRLELTPEGQTSPLLDFEGVGQTDAILTEMPSLLAATRVEREKAATMILLRQKPTDPGVPAMAAVAHQRVGRGQVMAVLGDGLWKWALLPADKARFDPVYDLFWSRAVRWLATGGEFLPGQEVSMKLDRLTVEPGQPVTVTLATRYVELGAFSPMLRLVSPDGRTREVEPKPVTGSSEFRAVVEPDSTGVWRVELTDTAPEPVIDPVSPITAQLAVYDRSLERLDPSARPRVLKQLTDATGGACWELHTPEVLLEQIESRRIARESDVAASYDFNRGWVLAVIVVALGLEWVLRRRGGLL